MLLLQLGMMKAVEKSLPEEDRALDVATEQVTTPAPLPIPLPHTHTYRHIRKHINTSDSFFLGNIDFLHTLPLHQPSYCESHTLLI